MDQNYTYDELGNVSNDTYIEPRPSTSAEMSGTHTRLITAAIDFGTTYSGYAYSYVHDPSKVYTHYWEVTSIKTPTVVLLKPDKTFAAFGVEAEETYRKLAKAREAENWYYFERFKMELYRKQPPMDINMTLVDMTGKSLRALDVFSAAIRYLMNHLLDTLNEKREYVTTLAHDIHWVLTVPAIWTDRAKRFMREAARENFHYKTERNYNRHELFLGCLLVGKHRCEIAIACALDHIKEQKVSSRSILISMKLLRLRVPNEQSINN